MEGRGVEFTFLNLVGHTIYRCVACDVCPSPRHRQKHKDQKSPYNCIVQVKTDEMKNIQKDLNSSDATILVGVNTHDDLIYRYQAFMERTRYIRRENFELTNRVIFGMLINNVGSFNNPLHNLKVLTSFIRHNMFVVKSIEVMRHEEKIIYQDSIKNQIEIIRQIKSGRNQTNYDKICYKATGYVNRELDHTVKSRR
jgi:multimeric flavodoxin WrbA